MINYVDSIEIRNYSPSYRTNVDKINVSNLSYKIAEISTDRNDIAHRELIFEFDNNRWMKTKVEHVGHRLERLIYRKLNVSIEISNDRRNFHYENNPSIE